MRWCAIYLTDRDNLLLDDFNQFSFWTSKCLELWYYPHSLVDLLTDKLCSELNYTELTLAELCTNQRDPAKNAIENKNCHTSLTCVLTVCRNFTKKYEMSLIEICTLIFSSECPLNRYICYNVMFAKIPTNLAGFCPVTSRQAVYRESGCIPCVRLYTRHQTVSKHQAVQCIPSIFLYTGKRWPQRPCRVC